MFLKKYFLEFVLRSNQGLLNLKEISFLENRKKITYIFYQRFFSHEQIKRYIGFVFVNLLAYARLFMYFGIYFRGNVLLRSGIMKASGKCEYYYW